MNRLKAGIAASMLLAAAATCPPANATIYGEGEGYYYIAFSATGGFPTPYQFMDVGPFAEEEDCLAARGIDQGNGGAWAPYYGSGIQCDWVYAGEVDSLQDAVDLWNNPISNGGNPPGHLDSATLQSISALRRIYDLDGFEAELKGILAPRR